MKGFEKLSSFLNRIIIIKKVIYKLKEKFNKLNYQFKQKTEKDNIVILAQKDTIK